MKSESRNEIIGWRVEWRTMWRRGIVDEKAAGEWRRGRERRWRVPSSALCLGGVAGTLSVDLYTALLCRNSNRAKVKMELLTGEVAVSIQSFLITDLLPPFGLCVHACRRLCECIKNWALAVELKTNIVKQHSISKSTIITFSAPPCVGLSLCGNLFGLWHLKM